MAHLGNASTQAIPADQATTTDTYGLNQGMLLDSADLFTFGGGDGVEPKRFLNKDGVWVPIQ